MQRPLEVEVFSDVVCPWCYVGKRRLEDAVASFGSPVRLTWRSFELDPSAPRGQSDEPASLAGRLAKKYGLSDERARAMLQQMTDTGAAEGLDLRFDQARTGSTFDAHRLLQYAGSQGLQGAMKERLMRAYFTEGEAVADVPTLERLGAEVGLDAGETQRVLRSDAYAEAVRSDEAEARALGVRGVPFFVVEGRFGLSGAQPASQLLAVLQRAQREGAEAAAVPPDADACDDVGCEH